jgi:hypothetical protein
MTFAYNENHLSRHTGFKKITSSCLFKILLLRSDNDNKEENTTRAHHGRNAQLFYRIGG